MKFIQIIFITLLLLSCSGNKNHTKSQQNHRVLISEISNPNQDILPALIKDKFKGKVVYVDIWATWCRPCLAEFPFSKTLHDKFAEKNVAFLSLCCLSKQDAWEKTIAQHELPGEHHLLNEVQCGYLKDKYQLVGFPTYMLFDKNGNLTYGDAPRPSSGSIEEILNGLIESQ
jgi:thiol-disulfide isomerase/thioredoxin